MNTNKIVKIKSYCHKYKICQPLRYQLVLLKSAPEGRRFWHVIDILYYTLFHSYALFTISLAIWSYL